MDVIQQGNSVNAKYLSGTQRMLTRRSVSKKYDVAIAHIRVSSQDPEHVTLVEEDYLSYKNPVVSFKVSLASSVGYTENRIIHLL
jgi:hypothetical protein